MKKADLIAAIQAEKPRLTKAEIQTVLDGLTLAAAATIARGEDFAIPGVARFSVTTRAARTGRNPATGAPVEIPEKAVVKAKVAGELAKQAA